MVALEYHNYNTESLASFYFASRSSATLRITLLLPFLPPTKSKPFAPNACPSSTWKQLLPKLTYGSRSTSNHVKNLYSTVDGKGLQETRKFPQANEWIRGGTRLMHGNSFIHSIDLHINQLPIREQTTRGGRPGERVCRGCKNYVETVSHVPQKCPHTHGPRIQRHDSITRLLADECAKQGWQVTWAPRIRTSGGIKKLDLIISNNYKIAIVDITVVWDSPEPLEITYQDKLDLYDQPSIRAHIAEAYGSNTEVQFGAIVISPRGAWCNRNESALAFLDLSKSLRDILIGRTMERSYKIYRTFMKIT